MADTPTRLEMQAKFDALQQEMHAESALLRGDIRVLGAEIKGSLDTMSLRFGQVNDSLGELSGKVQNFKWQVATAAIAVVLAVGAIGFAIQDMTVTTFEAAARVQAQTSATPAAKPAASQP